MHHRTHHAATIVTCLLLTTTALSPAATAAMSQEDLEARLLEMQERVDRSVTHLEAGDRAKALEDARFVRDQFSFNASGASPLEQAIKEVSAVAIGDRIKAQAARLVTALEAGQPTENVTAIAEDLAPDLNRLVLVAQGKHTPASQRELRTSQAIQDAAQEVTDHVETALDLYRKGQTTEAKQAAEEAFFTFETNGLGPDTSTVDDDLENEVENLIVNFDQATVSSDPGLSQLIEQGAGIDQVEAQAEEITQGLAQVVELLEATLPPMELGDANGDGKVTIVDALWVAQASLGIRAKADLMDANQDDRVTIVDALMIAQAALGIRSL